MAREGGLVTLLRTVLGHVRTDARLCFSLVGSAVGLQASADSSAASARRQLRARQALAAHCADLRPDPGAQWQWAQVRLRRRDERRSIHRHRRRNPPVPMSRRLASARRVVRDRQVAPSVRRLRRDVWCGVFVAGHHRAREQARPLKTVNGRNRSADRPGRDRRWRDRSSGSMRELFWRNRYRLGQWPVSPRDGAARDEAQCTVRPAQAGHAGKAAAWHCECRPR